MVAGAVALIVLGVHPPAELTGLLARAVARAGRSGMTRAAVPAALAASVPALWDEVVRAVDGGARLADLFATARPEGLLLTARLVAGAEVDRAGGHAPAGHGPLSGADAALWPPRSGTSARSTTCSGSFPEGHPRLQPLSAARRRRPGALLP